MMKSVLTFILFLSGITTHCLYSQLQFDNITTLSGIDHAHTSTIYMGGGVTFFDYNNDGFDDIFLTGGSNTDRLYKNMGNLQFEDVTNQMRLFRTNREHSMGVTVGDINNDGYKDIFVTYGVGETNRLYLNIEGIRFEDITIPSGLENFNWSMGASFGDLNLDGFLDLYVINWVEEFTALQDTEGNTVGFDHKGYANNLYINNGDNTFTEASSLYEVGNGEGCGLAVMITDYNNDTYPDIYIANDFGEWTVSNTILKNEFPEQNFSDQSVQSGLNAKIYGMGIAAGDYDRNGYIDYYTTNIGRNVLFKNNGTGIFDDATTEANVENIQTNELNTTGWGAVFADLDNDGYEDLLVSNGYVPAAQFIETAIEDPNKLYQNLGDGTFKDVTVDCNLGDTHISRGVATSDLDNDGDLDFLFTYLSTYINGKTETENILLYANNSLNDNHWLKFKMEGDQNNRDGYNARLNLYQDNEVFVRELYSSSSHGSQNSSMVHFGLGSHTKIDSLIVKWPGGNEDVYYDLQTNQNLYIKEGAPQLEVLGCMNEQSENFDPKATMSFGCKFSTITALEENLQRTFEIYPNPSTSAISIDIAYEIKSDLQLEFFNSKGILSKRHTITSTTGRNTIDISDIPSGMYIMKITSSNRSDVLRFMKK